MKLVLPELRYPRLWMAVGLVLAGVIAVLSLMPLRNVPDLDVSDKIKHALAYVALGFFFASVIVRRDWFWLAIALICFGALIELAQHVMPFGRSAEAKDMLANLAGIAVGLLLALTPLGSWARWLESRMFPKQG